MRGSFAATFFARFIKTRGIFEMKNNAVIKPNIPKKSYMQVSEQRYRVPKYLILKNLIGCCVYIVLEYPQK